VTWVENTSLEKGGSGTLPTYLLSHPAVSFVRLLSEIPAFSSVSRPPQRAETAQTQPQESRSQHGGEQRRLHLILWDNSEEEITATARHEFMALKAAHAQIKEFMTLLDMPNNGVFREENVGIMPKQQECSQLTASSLCRPCVVATRSLR